MRGELLGLGHALEGLLGLLQDSVDALVERVPGLQTLRHLPLGLVLLDLLLGLQLNHSTICSSQHGLEHLDLACHGRQRVKHLSSGRHDDF